MCGLAPAGLSMGTSPGVWDLPKDVPERWAILLELAYLVRLLTPSTIKLVDKIPHRRATRVQPLEEVHELLARCPI